jgi:hypothetical protein
MAKTRKKTGSGVRMSSSATSRMNEVGSVPDSDGYGRIDIPGVRKENVLTTIETAKAMLGPRFDSADVEREAGKDTYLVIIYTKPAGGG